MIRLLSCVFTGLLAMTTAEALAQETPYTPPAIDEDYISDYKDQLLVRLYTSQKFSALSYGEYGRKDAVRYKANNNYTVGFGFNYQWLGVNIGVAPSFINNDTKEFGRTHYLDMQGYIYLRKVAVDFYVQSYESYFLVSNDILQVAPTSRLIRSDIQTRNAGASFEYLFNGRRFSYRAAYLQNEYQRRSTGSFLAGAGFLYLNVRADSAIVPDNVRYTQFMDEKKFNSTSTGVVSAHGGYAHTFVINKHYFLLGSVILGVGGNTMTYKDEASRTSASGVNLSFNGIFRAGIGYNSERYYAGLYFVTNLRHDEMPIIDSWQRYETGMVRLAIARRFVLKPETVRLLEKTGLF